MADTKKTRTRIFTDTVKLLFQNGLSLLLGQGIILLIFIFVFTPFISRIYHLALSITGFRFVTIDNLGRFLLKPISLLMIVLLFFLIGLYMLFEIYYLIIYFSLLENGEKTKFYQVLLMAFYKMVFGIGKGNIKLIPSAWITIGIFNLPLLFYLMNRIRVVRFFMDEVSFTILLALIVVSVLILLCIFLLRKSFVIHFFLVENKTYREAVKNGRNIKRNKPFRTLLYYAGWNGFIFLIVLALYVFTMAVTALLVSAFFDKNLAIAIFASINENINGYFIILIFMISTIGNFAMYTHLFYHYRLPAGRKGIYLRIPDARQILKKEGSSKSYRKTGQIILIILLCVNSYFFVDILRNGSPLEYMNLDMIKVTSHRGFSHDVPENTIPAIEKAIEEQADYIELDVRATKDGELVLLHDENLYRTTGYYQNVWKEDYAKIAKLEAGSWLNPSFAGTKIPTLREAFEVCKGKVNLNLDLKYRNPKEGLEEKVIALIKEYDMDWQCVISSKNLLCLEKVKELDPDIRTGLIVHQLYKGLSTNETIDFLSMKASLMTKNAVREIHRNGKELFVWTVNTRSELERLKRIGVDNIITDNPAYAKEILFQTDQDPYFMTLFQIMTE